MVTNDTIELLKECDSGVKMGISAIDEVIDHIEDKKLADILSESKQDHKKLEDEIRESLDRYGDPGKEPSPMAKSMSWLKTNMKLSWDDSDRTASDLITDGCNMGIKSLRRYVNQYENAEESAKTIAKKVIHIEESLLKNMQPYL